MTTTKKTIDEIVTEVTASYLDRYGKNLVEDRLEYVLIDYYGNTGIKLSQEDLISVWKKSATNIRNESRL